MPATLRHDDGPKGTHEIGSVQIEILDAGDPRVDRGIAVGDVRRRRQPAAPNLSTRTNFFSLHNPSWFKIPSGALREPGRRRPTVACPLALNPIRDKPTHPFVFFPAVQALALFFKNNEVVLQTQDLRSPVALAHSNNSDAR